MSKVSVIIPVYNVAEYVEACLRCVIAQTYTDLEILVCDDGSTDKSGAICDCIAREDNRVHVIHTSNGGLSAARNTCLDVATGEFVTCVDSDDIVTCDYIEKMVQACVVCNADAALCDYCRVDESASVVPQSMRPSDVDASCKVYFNTECLEQIYHPTSSGMNFAAGFKLYRRSLFENPKVRYPIGKLHEDYFITWKLLYKASRIAYLQEPLYGYRIRGGSIMNKAFRIERSVVIEATKEQCDFFLKHDEQRLAELAVNNHLRMEFTIVANLQGLKNTAAKERARQIIQQLRVDCRQYLPQVNLPGYKKCIYCFTAAFPVPLLVQKLRMF